MGESLVLVTDGGDGQNRSALAAVRALAASGYSPVVTVSAPDSLAAASRFCRRRVPVPGVAAEGFADAVKAELRAHEYLAVLGASDMALVALDLPGAALLDKSVVAERAIRAGLAVLPERRFESAADLLDAASDVEFPAVVKPAVRGAASEGAVRVLTRAELAGVATWGGPVVVQPFVAGPITAVSGVMWHGRLMASAHQAYRRIWPPDCGVACAAETVPADEDLEGRLPALLSGYDGIFQLQFIAGHVIDLNPRVYGSLPLAVAAGANLPAILCRLLAGLPVEPVRARPGVRYRWIEGDVRNLLAAPRSGAGFVRELRPRRGTAHSVVSLTDPVPALVRARHVARSML